MDDWGNWRLNLNLMKPFELNDTEGDDTAGNFSITLGPGVVKYFSIEDFLEAKVDDVISTLNSLPGTFVLKIPRHDLRLEWPLRRRTIDPFERSGIKVNLTDNDSLFLMNNWEQRLRAHHAFCHFCISKGMPSSVYSEFHKLLGLKEFAFEECLNAWVDDAGPEEITDSYRNSTQHIVITYEQARSGRFRRLLGPIYDSYIFVKTPFVTEKLNTLEAIAADKAAAMELELLRKSKFNCFVYLMEDLRNKCFKIGKSKTPGKRERTLQSEVPQIVMRFSIPAEEAHEKQLHEHFSNKRKRGEWFELSNDDLAWIVTYMKTNGDASRAIMDYQWLGNIYFSSTTNAVCK